MYVTPVTSEIIISGYPNETIGSTYDFLTTSISIELSHVEAMEVWLECPNGSKVALINLHEGGPWEAIPGGYPTTSWYGTFLGDPTLEDVIGTPGTGWNYTFSSMTNTWGDMETELVNGNFLPATQFGNNGNSMNPNGVYLPYWTFDSLHGCPVDGTWTLNIQDNIDFNNGTLFEWGLNMAPISTALLEKTSEDLLHVLPNPVESVVEISVAPELINERYMIISAQGTVIMEAYVTSSKMVLDLSALEAGIYFVRIVGSEELDRLIKL